MVCTISDQGPGFDDPFAGYGPAHGEDLSRGGMGLWLARQLCDHVDITHDDDGVARPAHRPAELSARAQPNRSPRNDSLRFCWYFRSSS